MPYIFLDDDAIKSLQDVVSERIEYLEKAIQRQKAIWNDLGNTITPKEAGLPEKIKTDYQVIDKEGLIVEKFKYDKSLEKSYEKLTFCEMPDGRLCLRYIGNTLYTSKGKMLAIPYPTPPGYLKNSGLSSNQITAIRLYRAYLHSTDSDPDRAYKPMLKTDTRGNHGEDYEKIEGGLE